MGRTVEENYVAACRELTKVIGEARSRKLIRRDERWHFVVEDFDAPNFVVKDDIGAGRRGLPDTKMKFHTVLNRHSVNFVNVPTTSKIECLVSMNLMSQHKVTRAPEWFIIIT